MNKFKIISFIIVAFMATAGASYAAINWQPVWHSPSDYIAPGSTIGSKEMAENLQYLYEKVQVTKVYDNCDAIIVQDLDCKVPYTCNCGKYGCSTCYADGKHDQLKISCPNKAPVTFEGACRDPRKEQQCGKYGCTSITGN